MIILKEINLRFTLEQAKEYCKLPEGMKPSGLCYLYYEEYEVL